MEELQENKPVKKRPVGLIVAIAVIGVAILGGIIFFQRKSTFMDYNYTLYFSAKALNIGCPRMVGEALRLDSVKAKPSLQLWYYYTMTEETKAEDFDESVCDTYKESIVENLKGNPDMVEFGKNNVNLIFDLRDKNGDELCTAFVKPDEYYSSRP